MAESMMRGDLCRVTVIAPTARIDVAIPDDVPLAELVPTLLRRAGGDAAGQSGPQSGWSLQRFGEVVLDLSRTSADLSLRDGEILYLRPWQAELPEMAFDDVADAIATATSQQTRRWSGSDTRRAGLIATVAALGTAVLVLARTGPPWSGPGALAVVAALSLAAAGVMLSRAYADARAGAVLGYAGAAFAVLGGAALANGNRELGQFDALTIAGGAAAALVVAVLAAVGIAQSVPGFTGVAVAALLLLIPATLAATTGMSVIGTAALTAALALGLTQVIPSLALRLAELPLPSIPFTAEEVRQDNSAIAGRDILRKAQLADRFVTALVGALTFVVVCGALVLSTDHQGTAPWLLGVISAALALRARVFLGFAQRWFLLGAALLAAGLLAVTMADQVSMFTRLIAVALPLIAAAGVLVSSALMLPGRKVSPRLRRALDIVDALVIVSIVPLALSVLGVFGLVRGIRG